MSVCKHEYEEIDSWDKIGGIVTCPICKNKFEIMFDEFWDDDMDDEYGVWWLEPIKTE